MNKYTAILAIDQNLALGCKGKILFSNKVDLSYFKSLALNSCCVAGRGTYESLPVKLTNSLNCKVLSLDTYLCLNSNKYYESLSHLPKNNYLIIGGGEIYNHYYQEVSEWHITTHKQISEKADTWLDKEVFEYIKENFVCNNVYDDQYISIDIYTK